MAIVLVDGLVASTALVWHTAIDGTADNLPCTIDLIAVQP